MNATDLAYLAGAMDSDGFFSIKKSTYHMRVRKDAGCPVYSERMGLKQVTPEIPTLLHQSFAGRFSLQRASTVNGKPLYGWDATDLNASKACVLLLPYLRVKRRQAELLLELRESKQSHFWQAAYWFAREFPDWANMELVTLTETARMLGHTHESSISQAIGNGLILSLPYRRGHNHQPRIPKLLVERVATLAGSDGRAQRRPPELLAWRDRLYEKVRAMNRIGTGEHPISMRTGPYTPAAV